jgi:hypothetical protein
VAELGCFFAQLFVAERLRGRFEGADLCDERSKPLDLSFVLSADDLREQLADHANGKSRLRRNIYRL